MSKRPNGNRPKDINQLAHHLVRVSTESQFSLPTKEQLSALMSQLGRKGGKIGGKRRLQTMSAKERSQVAKKAAQARWHKKDK